MSRITKGTKITEGVDSIMMVQRLVGFLFLAGCLLSSCDDGVKVDGSIIDDTVSKIFEEEDLAGLSLTGKKINNNGIDGSIIHCKIVKGNLSNKPNDKLSSVLSEKLRKPIIGKVQSFKKYKDIAKEAGWLFDQKGSPRVEQYGTTKNGEFFIFYSGFHNEGFAFLIVIPM